MKFTPVVSSNVSAIAHDEKSNELHVQFKNGSHYVYEGVPSHIFHRALGSESIGKFLSEHVKGKFDHRKL